MIKRILALLNITAFMVVFGIPQGSYASHVGSSTVSAGSAPPPAATATQSFQPDLFTGRASFGVPIAVPPGRRGMQPSLGLSYSSTSQNGHCGVGWSLGAGQIERSTKKGIPRYDDTDVFVLSFQGVETELVTPAGGGVYYAKDEQLFLKIEFNGSDQWTVWDKGGTIYLFKTGLHDSLGHVYTWDLNRVVDTSGNYMEYVYEETTTDSGIERYLTEILYTGHEPTGLTPSNQVKFIWETRPDVEISYRSGLAKDGTTLLPICIRKRLLAVETYAMVDGVLKLARQHRLSYRESPLTKRSLLDSVMEVGQDGQTALTPAQFSYQSDDLPTYSACSNSANQTRVAWNVRVANKSFGHRTWTCEMPLNVSWSSPIEVQGTASPVSGVTVTVGSGGDIKINNTQDYFVHAYTAVYVDSDTTISLSRWAPWDVSCLYIESSTGISGNLNPSSISLRSGWNVLHLLIPYQGESLGFSNPLQTRVKYLNPTPFIQPSLTGDFDGNGVTDLCTFEPATGTWKVATANACWVRPEGVWASGFGSRSTLPLLGDWNGDGRTDIAVYDNNHWRFALSTGTSFQVDALPSVHDLGSIPVVGDFNGDGITDIAGVLKESGTWMVSLGTGSDWVSTQTWSNAWGADYEPMIGDFNGDGLTDAGAYYGHSELRVALSTGKSFAQATPWYFGKLPNRMSADVNGDGRTDAITFDKESGQIQYAPAESGAFGALRPLPATFHLSGQDVQLQVGDFNGDGVSDPAVFKPYSGAAELSHSEGEMPDLLKEVVNPLGGKTQIQYKPSTQYVNSFMPFVMPVVSEVTVSDGRGWEATTRYHYTGGLYDVGKKEFRGFAEVKVTDPEGNYAITRFHQDEHKKGRPYEQEGHDSAGRLYTKSVSTWECRELPSDAHFCHLTQQEAIVYDGERIHRKTGSRLEYDAYGNVIRTVEEGDATVTGDERITETEYRYNADSWLMAFPCHTVVMDAQGEKISEGWLVYDDNSSYDSPPTKGLVKSEERWLSPLTESSPKNPASSYRYDGYGNRIETKDAKGRVTLSTFDPNGIFPIEVKNTLGHSLRTSYDPRTGSVLNTTDPNGQTTQNLYDPLGRLIAVVGPQDTQALPGVRYEYDLLSPGLFRTTKRVKASVGYLGASFYTTYTFTDGLGRTIQVRSPANESGKQVVTGNVEWGVKGEVVAQYLSYLADAEDDYVPVPSEIAKAQYRYDILGRQTHVIDPDGSTTETQYDQWTTTVIDSKGNATTRETDAYGRLIKVTEPATADHGASTTRYRYDSAGRLTEVEDAQGNITKMTYDTLGRKLSMDDPDMGHWAYAYDLAGNLTRQTDTKGQTLEFGYDALNRLIWKKGLSPERTLPYYLVSYRYDEPAKPNAIGRLSKVLYHNGSTEFFYDRLGRETKTVKMIDGVSYSVQRRYDSLNRLTRLIYPGGTDLRYAYSAQGTTRIYAVNPDGSQTDFLTESDYNAAGEMLRVKLGNGVETNYTYDPLTLRIQEIKMTDPTGKTLQDLGYTFDPVGNLKTLANRVEGSSQVFDYDARYRLTSAQGSYGQYRYCFDELGNLLEKDNGMQMTYGLSNRTKPHAATSGTSLRAPEGGEAISSFTLSYDPNGNVLQKGEDRYSYDLENHLKEVCRPNSVNGQIQLALQPGWNLISVPFDSEGKTVSEVLQPLRLGPDYDQVSTRDSTGTSWSSFVGKSRYDQFTRLEPGKGYEIYITNPSGATLTLQGKTPERRPVISLKVGWNLIPSGVLAETPVTQVLPGLKAGTDYDRLLRFNASIKRWEAVSSFKPGEAYWIRCLKDKSWTVPTPQTQKTTTFTYDADGGRTKVNVDGITTGRYVGELYELLPGGTTRTHIFFGSTRLATLERTPVLTAKGSDPLGSDPTGFKSQLRRALAKVEETFVGRAYAETLPPGINIRYYHGDHLGSVNLITDHTGTQVELAEYTPFGTFSRSSSLRGSEATEAISDLYFTGQRLDASTGLYYFHARYYDPELGRFIQPDTIVQAPSDPQTLNRYTYCRNNPLIYTDPTGHFSWKRFFRAFVGAFVGVFATILLGPAGLALFGATMAGMIGGAIGGAITGGLNGGWRGALIGGVLGGALGGIGAWGVANHGWQFGAGMLAAGAGLAGATNSWDSFAGGLAGGIAGAFAGQGIINANSDRFQNFRAGKGFQSTRAIRAAEYERNLANIRALSVDQKDTTITYGSRRLETFTRGGPKHSFTVKDGTISEMGPRGGTGPDSGKIVTTDTVGDVSSWRTHIATENAIAAGATKTTSVSVSSWGWDASGRLYNGYFVGQPYSALNHNSNYYTATRIYGAGGDTSDDLGWTPEFK